MTTLPTGTTRAIITHVLVPIGVYKKLTSERSTPFHPTPTADLNAAITFTHAPQTSGHDADAILRGIICEGVSIARRRHDITQAQLGAGVGLSQPRISRIEKNPDAAPLGILRRIAEALSSLPAPSNPEEIPLPRPARGP